MSTCLSDCLAVNRINITMAEAGSSDGLEIIKEKFVGKWKLVRSSENFDDFLKEMGLNFLLRKMAVNSKPEVEMKVEDEFVSVSTKTGFWTREQKFKLGEKFMTENDGVKSECLAVWKDNKMIQENKPVDEASNIKPQTIHREIVNDELVMTIHVGDLVVTRTFQRMK